ncbi:hypothetical protein BGZ65_009003, partial [Modicella reniformis]
MSNSSSATASRKRKEAEKKQKRVDFLEQFLQANPDDYGPVEFVKWILRKRPSLYATVTKQKLNNSYKDLALLASQDINKHQVGTQMLTYFINDKTKLKKYWKKKQQDDEDDKKNEQEDQEQQKQQSRGGRKRRGSDDESGPSKKDKVNMEGPGLSSCNLDLEHCVVNGFDVSKKLMALRERNIEDQYNLTTVGNLSTLNFVFTASFMKSHHFPNQVVSQLTMTSPQCPSTSDVGFVGDCGILGLEQTVYEDFKKGLVELEGVTVDNGVGVGAMVIELMRTYTCTNAFWETGPLRRNERTFMKYHVDPIIEVLFGKMGLCDRDDFFPFPVELKGRPLRPDYLALKGGLPVVIVE